ncbi:MAG: polyphenol oxidase family protein [Acidobacteriota bacterium]
MGGTTFFVFQELEQIPGLVHAFTLRQSGAAFNEGNREALVGSEREALLGVLGIQPGQLIFLQQIHSNQVVDLNSAFPPEPDPSLIGPADGVLVESSARYPVIRTADCLPILAVAKGQVCLLHAGWRGTRDRIAARGIARLLKVSGASPQDVTVTIGPCIHKCCYQVGPEIKGEFEQEGHEVDQFFEGDRLDLVEANQRQIQELGVTRIFDSGMCTACRTDLFYSYRKEGETGRNWLLAGFRG